IGLLKHRGPAAAQPTVGHSGAAEMCTQFTLMWTPGMLRSFTAPATDPTASLYIWAPAFWTPPATWGLVPAAPAPMPSAPRLPAAPSPAAVTAATTGGDAAPAAPASEAAPGPRVPRTPVMVVPIAA